ncbi:MAG: methyltransferase domain-containing protein [Allosphingosinicella sp.]
MYLSRGPIGGRVAEVGPGGSAAVALFLIAEGAGHVDLVDRFAFAHDPAVQMRLYEEIVARDPRLAARGLSATDFGGSIDFHVGERAAAEVFFSVHSGYEAICSCAVLEHLYDPLSALVAMASALRPGGRMVHQVDLRDHGMFSAAGHHELTFLTVPQWFYPHMSRRRGRPNRVLIHRYRETLEQLDLRHELLVTHLVGIGAIEPAPYEQVPAELRARAEARAEEARGRLAPEFRHLPASDLAIASFRLVAEARA